MPLHNRGETTGGGKIDVHSYGPALPLSLSLKQLSAWNNGLETNKRGSKTRGNEANDRHTWSVFQPERKISKQSNRMEEIL